MEIFSKISFKWKNFFVTILTIVDVSSIQKRLKSSKCAFKNVSMDDEKSLIIMRD